jgi:hypothetical protein
MVLVQHYSYAIYLYNFEQLAAQQGVAEENGSIGDILRDSAKDLS